MTPFAGAAWGYGGIPRVVDALAAGLRRRGHEVTVATTDACDASARLPASERDGAVVFRNVSNALAYHLQLFLPLGMRGWTKREARRFDVAHLHACHNLPTSWAARALTRARVPYALQPHGTLPRIERRRAAKWLFDHTLGRGLVENATRVLAVSRAEAAQLASLGVRERALELLPNPVAAFPEPEPDRFRARHPFSELVVYLGKLTPRKRLDVLVDAFAALARPQAGLVLCGNDMGEGRALAARVTELGLGERVRLTGIVRGSERLEALAAADVVAYPAEHEVFGLVVVESLLCGTPVVVADDSGAAEIVRAAGGGRIVKAGSVSELAQALGAMLDERARWRKEAQAARTGVAQAYDPDRVCERLEAIYLDMRRGAS